MACQPTALRRCCSSAAERKVWTTPELVGAGSIQPPRLLLPRPALMRSHPGLLSRSLLLAGCIFWVLVPLPPPLVVRISLAVQALSPPHAPQVDHPSTLTLALVLRALCLMAALGGGRCPSRPAALPKGPPQVQAGQLTLDRRTLLLRPCRLPIYPLGSVNVLPLLPSTKNCVSGTFFARATRRRV